MGVNNDSVNYNKKIKIVQSNSAEERSKLFKTQDP